MAIDDDVVQDLNIRVQEQQVEIDLLRHKVEKKEGDKMHSEDLLKEMTAKKMILQQKHTSTQKKLIKANGMYLSTLKDLFHLEDDLLPRSDELTTGSNDMESLSQSEKGLLVRKLCVGTKFIVMKYVSCILSKHSLLF